MLEVPRGFGHVFRATIEERVKTFVNTGGAPWRKKNFGFKPPVEDLLGISTSDLAEVC